MNKLTHEDYLDIKAGSVDGNFTLAWAKAHVPELLAHIEALKEALRQTRTKSAERREAICVLSELLETVR